MEGEETSPEAVTMRTTAAEREREPFRRLSPGLAKQLRTSASFGRTPSAQRSSLGQCSLVSVVLEPVYTVVAVLLKVLIGRSR